MINSDIDADPTFASHTQDEESGQYYAKQRYYDPETGRFNRLDPVKDNLNWYAYCGGDPVNSIDPDGQFAIVLPIIGVVAISTEVILAVAGGMTLGAAIAYVVEKYGDEISEYIDDIIDYVEAALKDTDDPEKDKKIREKIWGDIQGKLWGDLFDQLFGGGKVKWTNEKKKFYNGDKTKEYGNEDDAWNDALKDWEDFLKIPGAKVITDEEDLKIIEIDNGDGTITRIILRKGEHSGSGVTIEIQTTGLKSIKIGYKVKKTSTNDEQEPSDTSNDNSDSSDSSEQSPDQQNGN